MNPRTISQVPDLTSLGLENLLPTGTNPRNKNYVPGLQEQRAIEAAEKGREAEEVVAALIRAYQDSLASQAGPQLAYAKASWRVPESAPKVYLDPEAVGNAVEELWLLGREDEATEVLRRAINEASNGPQRRSDQVRDRETYLEQIEQDRALEQQKLDEASQMLADERMAQELSGIRKRTATMRLTPSEHLNSKATTPYGEQ